MRSGVTMQNYDSCKKMCCGAIRSVLNWTPCGALAFRSTPIKQNRDLQPVFWGMSKIVVMYFGVDGVEQNNVFWGRSG